MVVRTKRIDIIAQGRALPLATAGNRRRSGTGGAPAGEPAIQIDGFQAENISTDFEDAGFTEDYSSDTPIFRIRAQPTTVDWSIVVNHGDLFKFYEEDGVVWKDEDGYVYVVVNPDSVDEEILFTDGAYNITFRATQGMSSADFSYNLVVQPRVITDLDLSSNQLLENRTFQSIALLTPTPNYSGVTYSLGDNFGDRFMIDNDSATLLAAAQPTDYEDTPTFDLVIIVTIDGVDYPFEREILIVDEDEISDISITGSGFTVGAAPGTIFGGMMSTPPAASFTLIDDAGGRVAHDGPDLKTGTTVTTEDDQPTISITIRASRGGETFDKSFDIPINDPA